MGETPERRVYGDWETRVVRDAGEICCTYPEPVPAFGPRFVLRRSRILPVTDVAGGVRGGSGVPEEYSLPLEDGEGREKTMEGEGREREREIVKWTEVGVWDLGVTGVGVHESDGRRW